MRIALLGCGKAKSGAAGEVAVRDLYTSSLFQKSLVLAEATSDKVLVVSAGHHLLDLDEKIASYDQALTGYSKRDRESWGARVASILVEREKLYIDKASHTITIYAGEEYAAPIRAALFARYALAVVSPLRGLQVGQRLAHLNQALAEWSRDRPRFLDRKVHDRPHAIVGLTSYRLRGPLGWIMIAAKNHADAMREAARSTSAPDRAKLEVWNGDQYVAAVEG